MRLRTSLLLCLAAAGAGLSQDAEPAALVITYRCLPTQRVALKQHMLTSGVRQFRHWREAGILADYHVLFSRYVDTDSWDMMSLLTFASYAGLEKWQQVESVTPAGLSQDTLALTLVVNSYPVRLARHNAAQTASPQPVYLVIANGEAGHAPDDLAYGLYQRRFGAARPWDSLLVVEFPSEEALGAREKTLPKDQSGQAVVADELTISR